MSNIRATIRRGLYFGLVGGAVGGVLWALIGFLESPQGALTASIVGTLFWLVVGFIVGLFNPPRSGRETVPGNERQRNTWGASTLRAVGRFFYRIVIGSLIGTIIIHVVLFSVIVVGVAIFGSLDQVLESMGKRLPYAWVIIFSLTAIDAGGFIGALAGALLGAMPAEAHGKPGISKRSALGCIIGMGLASKDGALIGAMVAFQDLHREETSDLQTVAMAVAIMSGVIAGILGAILAGLFHRYTPKVTHERASELAEFRTQT
jgi:hypothetical protein